MLEGFLSRLPGPLKGWAEKLQTGNVHAVLGVGGAAGVILIAAIIGAIGVGGGGTTHAAKQRNAQDVTAGPSGGDVTGETSTTAAGATATTAGAGGPGGAAANKPGAKAAGTGPGGHTTDTLASKPGETRIGVGADFVKWGLHAPQTFNGAPLALAADPLEGVGIYVTAINNAGGINGRKIDEIFADDRYTTDGAAQAADKLLNDAKVFHVSGTLGVDQVAIVATRASQTKPAPTPYMAAGASERVFQKEGIRMWQIAGSYDTHLKELVHFLAQEVKKPAGQSIYAGKKRIGVSVLDSKYIIDPVAAMEAEVKGCNCGLEWAGSVTVPKYTDTNNTHNYGSQIQELKSKNPDIVVPAQDPLTTQAEVSQCIPQACQWKWSFSDFAHDEDLALGLQSGQWTGVRGLSSGCYYQDYTKGFPCGKLKEAHDAWVSVKGQGDWDQHGQGGASGYQVVHAWVGALRNAGPDLTRERFTAALNAYKGYDDLVTGPITYAGSPNTVHGVELMAVYEAQSNQKWKMISNGLTSPF